MARLSLLVLLLSFCGVVGEAAPAAEWTLPEVSLRPATSAIRPGDDIWFHVSLENGKSGCQPVLISQRYSGFVDSSRPVTVLEFEITDERGGRVSRSGSYSGMRPRYVVGDVMMLGCGASYGWYVVVGKPEWEYSLKPGTYRLRARIENRVRSFFEQHVAQLKTLVAATGIDKAELMLSLRDFSVTSNEITIEVAAK